MLIKIILQIIKNIFPMYKNPYFLKKLILIICLKNLNLTTFLILNPIDIFHSYRKTIKIKMIET